MMEASVNALDCPQCGAEVALRAGERFPDCGFCGTTLYVDSSGLVGHLRLPRLLERPAAEQELRRWMAGNDTVKDLDRKSRLESMEALRFPMWLFRTRGANGEKVLVEPAAATPIPQLADLMLPAGRLEPATAIADEGESISATVPLETAREWVAQRGISDVSEEALVEVPLWRATYTHQGRRYQALIEASTGSVLASVYPEKAESPYFMVALVSLAVFFVLGLAISNPFAKALAYLVAGAPLVLLAFWVARKV